MNIKLLELDDLRNQCRAAERDEFASSYPGAFLLAMGFVDAEMIRGRRRMATETATRDETASFSFGEHMRHDASATHPLAGCAFYLQPSGDPRPITIGRGSECDLTVPDRSVSEHHCHIDITDLGVVALDQGSTNGTSINLERLETGVPRVLADEDILTIGRYSFQLLASPTMYRELELMDLVTAE